MTTRGRETTQALRLGALALGCLMVWSGAGANDAVDGAPDRVYQRELLRETGTPLPPLKAAQARAAAPQRTPPAQAQARPPDMSAPMTLDLRQISVNSALRLISEVAQANIVATQAAGERELSLYMAQTTAGEALDAVARVTGLWARWRPGSRTWMVMTAPEYQRELTVFGEERTEVLHLRHHNVVSAASTLRSMFGERVVLQVPVEEALGETMKVTDLRRSDDNDRRRNTNSNDSGISRDAAALGMVTARRGGTARPGRQDEASQQVTAAAAEAQATTAQAEAVLQGQEAPLYVTYNRQHNLLILRTGDDRVMAQAVRLVRQIDLPARQVLLEMRIVQIRLGDEFHRAFDMEFFGTGAATGVATSATGQPLNPLTGATAATRDGLVVAPRQLGALGMYDQFDRNTGLFQFLNNRIRLRLQLLEEKGHVQTLARPLLLASNNESARLFIGEEVVLVTGASAQTTTGTTGATNTVITAETEQRDIGTTLVIHPRINDDRTVTLTIDQENSERVIGGTTIPLATGNVGDGVVQYPIDTVNTSAVQAVAQAKDGLTIAIGGMIKINKTNKSANVPGLSRIPLLGELFKKNEVVDERTELVLIITPHVLESSEEAEHVTRRVGGTVMSSARLHLNGGPAGEPRQQAQRLADVVLEGMGDPHPSWEMEPGMRREEVPLWMDAAWPGNPWRTTVKGAWNWNGMTAVALELAHAEQAPLAALTPASLPGNWLAVAMDEAPAGAPQRDYTRRLVLVSQESWAELSRRLQP